MYVIEMIFHIMYHILFTQTKFYMDYIFLFKIYYYYLIDFLTLMKCQKKQV